MRDSKGRFVSSKSNTTEYGKVNATENNTNNKEIKTMRTNNQENRMETLKNAGINTQNFFSVTVNAPVGSNVQILVDGVPYTVNSNGNVVNSIVGKDGAVVTDKVIEKIMEQGYVFNRKTDGRWVAAQTFRMLNERSWNSVIKEYETGWDAYLRNNYGYMYQFDMVADELHRLAKMERENDPEFARLSRFFTKEVVVELCNQYIRQLKKFIKNQPVHKCRGERYVKLNRFGNVFVKDLQRKIYAPLEDKIEMLKISETYSKLEASFKFFTAHMCKIPYITSMCSAFKDAFKGKGAYVTLLNLCKFHGCFIVSDITGEILYGINAVQFIENKFSEYNGQGWRYHELLKKVIKDNHFDLEESINSQK